jgi:hypothetical protein
MYEQLLAGLEAAPPGSICYLCEHDVFYHPSHFAFLPKDADHAYFNTNRYHYRQGHSSFLKARGKRALSQCVAYREMLIDHCKERLDLWAQGQDTRMKIRFFNFSSDRPNVDIRHGENLTPDGDYKKAWLRGETSEHTVYNLPGWGSPPHFESKVGYKEVIQPGSQDDAQQYLRTKYARWFPQVSPVRIPRMRRKHLSRLFATLGYTTGAEVGVREGRFSQHLAKNVPSLHLYCIDPWAPYYHFNDPDEHERHLQEAQNRLQPYNATFIRKTSLQAASDIEDDSLDFVYIDGDHRFDQIMLDLILWGEKVRPGGMICGHDYYRFRNAGVVQAVDIYTRMHQVDPWYLTDEKEASFFWAKE